MARRRKWVLVSLLLLLSAGAALHETGRLAVWLGREWTITHAGGSLHLSAGMSLPEVTKQLSGKYSIRSDSSARSGEDTFVYTWDAGEAWTLRFLDGKLVDVQRTENP